MVGWGRRWKKILQVSIGSDGRTPNYRVEEDKNRDIMQSGKIRGEDRTKANGLPTGMNTEGKWWKQRGDITKETSMDGKGRKRARYGRRFNKKKSAKYNSTNSTKDTRKWQVMELVPKTGLDGRTD